MIVCEALGICLLALGVGCALGVLAAQVFVDHSALSEPDHARATPQGRSPGGSPSRSASDCSVRPTRPGARSGWNRSKRCVENDAVAQPKHPVGARCDLLVVRDQQDRRPALRAKTLEQIEHLRARRRIERAGRLVGEQQPRLVRERARDGDALAFASRQHRRPRADPVVKPTSSSSPTARASRSRRPRPRPNIGSWTFSAAVSVGTRWCDWNTKPTSRRGTRPGRRGDSSASPADDDRAGVRTVERADQVEERALARARRAGERDELSRLDGERDVLERPHPSVLERLADVIDDDPRAAHLSVR